jgi:hypothetical protein
VPSKPHGTPPSGTGAGRIRRTRRTPNNVSRAVTVTSPCHQRCGASRNHSPMRSEHRDQVHRCLSRSSAVLHEVLDRAPGRDGVEGLTPAARTTTRTWLSAGSGWAASASIRAPGGCPARMPAWQRRSPEPEPSGNVLRGVPLELPVDCQPRRLSVLQHHSRWSPVAWLRPGCPAVQSEEADFAQHVEGAGVRIRHGMGCAGGGSTPSPTCRRRRD